MVAPPQPVVRQVRFVSFIIPAWNEASVLPATLAAVNAVTQRLAVPCEVIVADDASTDRTAEVARAGGARVVSVNHRQIAAARNAGAKAARGDLFFFVDADMLIAEDVVRAAIESVRRGVVGGGCVSRFDGRVPLYARVLQVLMVRFARITGIAGGCFFFCTREAFRAAGGFDRRLYAAEEVALSVALRRLGRFVVLPQFVTTSGRKVRTYSSRELFASLLRFLFRGRKSLRDRRGLDIWYGDRRPDPKSGGCT
jgi:glycosyltransferase involved in cell wall biosynthesis